MIDDAPRQPCVLVVEDHGSNRELVARVLTAAGYLVSRPTDPSVAQKRHCRNSEPNRSIRH